VEESIAPLAAKTMKVTIDASSGVNIIMPKLMACNMRRKPTQRKQLGTENRLKAGGSAQRQQLTTKYSRAQ
jgi:hypothetical protein